MKRDIHTFVAKCNTFQRNKGETIKTLGTLQLLPIPPTIWTNISMDFTIGLPKSGNMLVIVVVVDHLSKYALFFFSPTPMHGNYSGSIFLWKISPNSMTCLTLLSPTVIQLSPTNFGKNCSSSRGPNCISTRPITPKMMVKIKLSTSAWKHILGVLRSTRKNQWAQRLPLAKWWYNTSYHVATRKTPFEAVYGQKPSSLLSYRQHTYNSSCHSPYPPRKFGHG
jgi:hypothetical protein